MNCQTNVMFCQTKLCTDRQKLCNVRQNYIQKYVTMHWQQCTVRLSVHWTSLRMKKKCKKVVQIKDYEYAYKLKCTFAYIISELKPIYWVNVTRP